MALFKDFFSINSILSFSYLFISGKSMKQLGELIWRFPMIILIQATDQHYEDCKKLLRLIGVPVIEVILRMIFIKLTILKEFMALLEILLRKL